MPNFESGNRKQEFRRHNLRQPLKRPANHWIAGTCGLGPITLSPRHKNPVSRKSPETSGVAAGQHSTAWYRNLELPGPCLERPFTPYILRKANSMESLFTALRYRAPGRRAVFRAPRGMCRVSGGGSPPTPPLPWPGHMRRRLPGGHPEFPESPRRRISIHHWRW